MPHLHFTVWGDLVDGFDPELLLSLGAIPEPTNPFHDFYLKMVNVFVNEQEELNRLAGHLRLSLMDKGKGQENLKTFNPLAIETRQDYGSYWGRWCVYVCRLYKLQKDGDTSYDVVMSPAQEKLAQMAWDYTYKTPGQQKCNAEGLAASLPQAFWSPECNKNFSYMCENQFNDMTVWFAAFVCLEQEGTFNQPRSAADKPVRVKYMVQAGMLRWAMWYIKEHNQLSIA
ncbi:hypothetical protein RhiJN_11761 [Ceratobasidium sp. AG-Ba]|nr:hypothetical protein RhiJN_11761 [Ceratobasidium sp. AG-Ba]QRW12382.1 hypothetical protein RhiLY_11381 [Ceratobasidium sp. AG-Ba]